MGGVHFSHRTLQSVRRADIQNVRDSDVSKEKRNYNTIRSTPAASGKTSPEIRMKREWEREKIYRFLTRILYYKYVCPVGGCGATMLLMGKVRVGPESCGGGPAVHNGLNALRPIDRGQWCAMQNTPPYRFPTSSLFFGARFADRYNTQTRTHVRQIRLYILLYTCAHIHTHTHTRHTRPHALTFICRIARA